MAKLIYSQPEMKYPCNFIYRSMRGIWDEILEILKRNCALWRWEHFSWLLLLCCDLILFAHCHVDKITMKMTSWGKKIHTFLVLSFVFASSSSIWLGKAIMLSSNLYSMCCLFIILIGSESWRQGTSQAIWHYFIQHLEGIGNCAK